MTGHRPRAAPRASTRPFLVAAAVGDLIAGAALIRRGHQPDEDGSRGPEWTGGWLLIGFAGLFAVAAYRPSAALTILGAVAKAVGATSGAIGLARGRRDLQTVLSTTDALWLPGFIALALPRTRTLAGPRH